MLWSGVDQHQPPRQFCDGLGDRWVRTTSTGDTVEVLRPCRELARMRAAICERVTRMTTLRLARVVPVRGVEVVHDGDMGIEIVSDHVSGRRLSDILLASRAGQLDVSTDAALHIIRQALGALAALHQSRSVTHGALAPERLIITPRGHVVIADCVLGLAIERLNFSRDKLWEEFQIPMPPGGDSPQFNQQSDVAQVAFVALALLAGRPLDVSDVQGRLSSLLETLRLSGGDAAGALIPKALRTWLAGLLGLEKSTRLATAREAQVTLADALSKARWRSSAENPIAAMMLSLDPPPTASTVVPAVAPTVVPATSDELWLDGPPAFAPLHVSRVPQEPAQITPAEEPAFQSVTAPIRSQPESGIRRNHDTTRVGPVQPLTRPARKPRRSKPRRAGVVAGLSRVGKAPALLWRVAVWQWHVVMWLPRMFGRAVRATGGFAVAGLVHAARMPVRLARAMARTAVRIARGTAHTAVRVTRGTAHATARVARGTAHATARVARGTVRAPIHVASGSARAVARGTHSAAHALDAVGATTLAALASVGRALAWMLSGLLWVPRAIGRELGTAGGSAVHALGRSMRSTTGAIGASAGSTARFVGAATIGAARLARGAAIGIGRVAGGATRGTARVASGVARATRALGATIAGVLAWGLHALLWVPRAFGRAAGAVGGAAVDGLMLAGRATRRLSKGTAGVAAHAIRGAVHVTSRVASLTWRETSRLVRAGGRGGYAAGAAIASGSARGVRATGRGAILAGTAALRTGTRALGTARLVDRSARHPFVRPQYVFAVLVAIVAWSGVQLAGAQWRGLLKPWMSRVELAKGNESLVRVASTPSAASGRLQIDSDPPGAQVYLDGKLKGETPLALHQVKPGPHTVLLRHVAGSVRTTVLVEEGKSAEVQLPIYSGWLAVFAPAELQILEGGVVVGTTESGRILVKPGSHALELVNAPLGFRTTKNVEVQPGEVTLLNIDLPPAPLEVVAPPGAEIWFDGKLIGNAPIQNQSVAVGTFEVVMRHPALGERRQTTTVGYGATNRIVFPSQH